MTDKYAFITDLAECKKVLAVADEVASTWERRAVPCDCKVPLGGFTPSVGPRCRLCGAQFKVVQVEDERE